MAEVYKAYDSHLNRQVAVKVIHDHLNDDVEFIERFENEAIMLAGLRHPNIVQVIDRGQTERFHYMVMEFVPGRSLEAKLKERQAQGQPFTPVEAVPIVEELASAIDYAHNQGVIHHDLKPNNILFTADGQIVLTDFGIARIVALPNYTVPGLVLGTPAYMAPEQARGQRGDPRSDVFSMGVLLYEMMTGRVPLKARTPWEMVMKYTNEQPPPPASINPAISPAVERVILKALSQSPDKRYQTARGLARALA
jgi:serine/threonine-protein kinase